MFETILECCNVIAYKTVDGIRYVYFLEHGRGYVQSDEWDDEEGYLCYSCSSLEEFARICGE